MRHGHCLPSWTRLRWSETLSAPFGPAGLAAAAGAATAPAAAHGAYRRGAGSCAHRYGRGEKGEYAVRLAAAAGTVRVPSGSHRLEALELRLAGIAGVLVEWHRLSPLEAVRFRAPESDIAILGSRRCARNDTVSQRPDG